MKFPMVFTMMVVLLAGCSDPTNVPSEHITSGRLNIGVDNSFQPLMDTEIYTYTALNANAEITPVYLPEGEIFDLLMKDSVQAAVVGRPLTEKEVEYFKSIDRMPESIHFAVDAVTLIIHPSNKDTSLTLDQVRSMFQGKVNNWNQVNPMSELGAINIVFDNTRSSNARMLKEKLVDGGEFPSNCFAVHTNEEVINYVAQNKNAVGVISLNWISDNADKRAQKFSEKVKVAGIIDPANKERPDKARKPFQAYVYDGSYPLKRDVYYIRTGLSGTLGTGFANHLLNAKGQLIIDRIGLVPITPQERILKITD